MSIKPLHRAMGVLMSNVYWHMLKAKMSDKPIIDCVAFDLDGVVIPSTPVMRYFSREFDIHSINVVDFFKGPFQDCLVGKTDLFDVLPAALQSWGWKRPMEEFVSEWMSTCSDPEPDAVIVISDLNAAGVRCCVASNQDNRKAAYLSDLDWIQNLFEKRFFSCHMGVAKPGSRYFRIIEEDFGAKPETILFVDDKVENINAARACGWQAELCRGATELRAILAHYCPEVVSLMPPEITLKPLLTEVG